MISLFIIALDIMMLAGSFWLTLNIATINGFDIPWSLLFRQIFFPEMFATVLLFKTNHLFRYHSSVSLDEFRSIIVNLFNAHLIVLFSLFCAGLPSYSFFVIPINFLAGAFLITLMRFGLKHYLSWIPGLRIPVVIIGKPKDVSAAVELLKKSRRLFLRPVQIISLSPEFTASVAGIPASNYSVELCNQLVAAGSCVAFVANYEEVSASWDGLITEISHIFDETYLMSGSIKQGTLSSVLLNLAGHQAILIKKSTGQTAGLQVKRAIDLILSGIFIGFFFPLYVFLGLLVYINTDRRIIFKQTRMGKNSKPFVIYKFQSMKAEAHNTLQTLLANDPDALREYQRYRKMRNDPRVTPLGRIMRKYSLDELPQIVNIFRGDMSLVGPRPYTPDEIDPSTPEGKKILSVLPGITGWWQVMGRNATTFQERQELDQYYVDNWSIWMDCYIFFKSFWVVLNGTGR
jgi:Undecaprenyl-phosphate galactose phosphotransferase WbaP